MRDFSFHKRQASSKIRYDEATAYIASASWQKGTGPIVRIPPIEYSIDDPAAVKAIYVSGSGFVKVSGRLQPE